MEEYTGTQGYHRMPITDLLVTDGVLGFIKNAGAMKKDAVNKILTKLFPDVLIIQVPLYDLFASSHFSSEINFAQA